MSPTPRPPPQPTTTIRPREPQDLLPLTHLLQVVYEQDAYPVQGTTHAEEFLTQPSTLRAWVAESSSSSSSSSSSEAEEGKNDVGNGNRKKGTPSGGGGKGKRVVVGHVAVSRPREGDVAVRLWRALHPPRGSRAGGRKGKEGQGQEQGQGEGGVEEEEKKEEEEEEDDDDDDDAEEEGEEEPIAVLERLFIHPSARGQGLASSLLGTVEEWAASNTSLPEEKNSPAMGGSSGGDGDDGGGGDGGGNPTNHPPKKKTKQELKEKKKRKGIRLLLFALAKDEPAMRLYRRRGWTEFGRTGFTWAEGPSPGAREEGKEEEGGGGEEEGEGEENKKEMGAICFVSPLPPPAVKAS